MGWLRELMDQKEPRLASFDRLASACLRHGDWPAGVQPKSRSLAALFSKFDRGIELEWLDDRPQAQVALARVLGCGLPGIQESVRRGVRTADGTSHRYRLVDAPFARLLRLDEEPLPPGIPSLLNRPEEWRRPLWWSPLAGDGSDLVRAWFEARLRVQTLRFQTWAEIPPALAGGGPNSFLFLEVSEPAPTPFPLPVSSGLCVRAPGPAPSGFEQLSSANLDTERRAIGSWLQTLFGTDGHFEASAYDAWLTTNVVTELPISWQGLVGLAAVFNEFGGPALLGRPLGDVVSQWLERRFLEASPDLVAAPQWQSILGSGLLIGLARTATVTPGCSWERAKTLAEWSALVPPDIRRVVETSTASALLTRRHRQVTAEELEGALRRRRGNEDPALAGLLATQSLRLVSDGNRFQLTPTWLSQWALKAAVTSLPSRKPQEWGGALLNSAGNRDVSAQLGEHLRTGGAEFLETFLASKTDSTSPASVLALEELAVLVGQAILEGILFPPALLDGLLERQLSVCLSFAGMVTPRLFCTRSNELLYTEWQLSCWAITECVSGIPGTCPAELDPWGAPEVPEAATLDRLERALHRWPFGPRVMGAFRLLGRLFEHEPPSARTHRLLAPAWVQPEDAWLRFADVAECVHGPQAFVNLRSSEAWGTLCAAAFRAWMNADFPRVGLALFQHPDSEVNLWQHIPISVLLALVARAVPGLCIPWQRLTEDQYGAVLHAAWDHLPEGAFGMLSQIGPDWVPSAVSWYSPATAEPEWLALWAKQPERVALACFELMQQPGNSVPELLRRAPVSVHARVVSAFRSWRLSNPLLPGARGAVCQSLQEFAVARGDGWELAYATLCELLDEELR